MFAENLNYTAIGIILTRRCMNKFAFLSFGLAKGLEWLS